MSIDVEKALRASLPATEASWGEDDVIIYHLGLGAGASWMDPKELEYTFEKSLKVLPTFATTRVIAVMRHVFAAPGIEVQPFAVVHGEHEVVVHDAIPRSGSIRTESRISAIYDRGTGAVLEIENKSYEAEDGRLLVTNIWSLFVRGEGGFGGSPAPKVEVTLPERDPDARLTLSILPQQAQIYRLSGDRNPYHVDPEAAAAAGFDTPILHGLCSYGMVCKAAVDTLLDGDVTRVARYRARFAKPVHPGEAIDFSAWQDGSRIVIGTKIRERGTPLVTNCWLESR